MACATETKKRGDSALAADSNDHTIFAACNIRDRTLFGTPYSTLKAQGIAPLLSKAPTFDIHARPLHGAEEQLLVGHGLAHGSR